ncbi:hypothetical protein B0T10DRAFT_532514 [Thelonectria olida]|uniref:Uncharacterized protein n=1 Tax=Thelonectria olida TaxID=1576542 RepID=A0A9P8VN52_9HYPO|nr:hypothetical protein B0T10DRAFT_534410 [Thelonectria olida]KAH6876803.1 hypothetical protein B0T10DRAFT_532514 [Thelonectria olida]
MSGTSDYSVFASWFEVIYTDEDNKPSDTLNEINNSSADINKGFGGKFVWLRIHRAPKPSMMVNHFWTDIRDSPIPGRDDDLAKGAGGDFRYLQWSNDMGVNHFVTDLALWRTGSEESRPPVGWDGKTDDINKGRGGDFLYLIWKVREYTGPKSP